MTERILKKFLNAEVAGLVLVFMAIQVLLLGVLTAIRDVQVSDLSWSCLAGALTGLLGGKSKWNGRQMSAMVITMGLIGVWIIGARVAAPIFDLIRSVIDAGPQIFPRLSYRLDIDASGITSAWNSIEISSSALVARWQTWLFDSTKDVRVNDALIRNMIWTFAAWLLSAWIGWFAAKRNALASLLPGVLLLTLLLWTNERRAESLWAFVMLMLSIMGLWNYRNHIEHWETNRIDYSDSIRVDMSQYVSMLIVVVGLLSYFTPSVSWRELRDRFRESEQSGQTERVASPSENANAVPQSSNLVPTSTLPREHLLTAGQAQSTEIVMTVKTGELPPVPMQSLMTRVPRYYWRSVVYDRYDGRGWFTTSAPSRSFAANQPMIAGVLSGYKLLHLNVQMQQPEGKLFWSGMLFSADVPLQVDWRLRPQSSLFADQTALLQADMFAARTDATAYRTESFVPTPSIQQLRAASAAEYPQHIQNLYLTLPAALPQRVHHLAGEITAGKATPYDKAKAIETYLRANYPYDLNISAPPQDQDVVDYFLFDLKRGYCDYYATAMVVLSRASGLPARFVSGYASGDYDLPNAEYIVRELHAHSWVEVYFSDIGWVEFEPTGNQPEFERAEETLPLPAKDGPDSISKNFYVQLTGWKWRVLFIPIAIAIVAAIIYYIFMEPLFFTRVSPVVAIEILYQRLYRSARPLAGKPAPAETADEFMHKLIQNIRALHAEFDRSHQVLHKDVKDLTKIYHNALFSNHPVDHDDVMHALHIWKRLRWALTIERIKRFFWMRNKVSR